MSNTTDKDNDINPILVYVCLKEHDKIVLKQQQQRIVLLRHASNCHHDIGKCIVTPHCAYMKNLWKHIISCKDLDCTFNHCISSRYVLYHYSKCIDTSCPICQPVRTAIKKSFQKSRNSNTTISNRTYVNVIDLTDDKDSVIEEKP